MGDLGLTKPRAEWGAGRRWTLGLMFLEDPIPRLCAGANPLGGAQTPACTRTRGAAVTPKSETTRPPSHSRRGIERVGSPQVIEPGRQGTRFSTLRTVRASNQPLSRSPVQETGPREARSAQAPRPCACRAVTGLGYSPLLPPRTPTQPTLSASQAHSARAPPGSLSHLGSFTPACGSQSSPPPCSPAPAPGYLLRDAGQRDRERSGRTAAPHRADFAIRGWGSGEV